MNYRVFYIFLILCLSSLNRLPAGHAQTPGSEFLAPSEAFRIEAYAENAQSLRLEFLITQGYYLYKNRLSFALTPEDMRRNLKLIMPQMPQGEAKEDEFFGKQEVFHSSFILKVPVQSAASLGKQDIHLILGLQGCADAGLCYPPEKRFFTLQLPALPIYASNQSTGGIFESEQDRLAKLISHGSLFWMLATFFALGLLLAFTPCVLPMVPILSGIIAGQSGPITTRRAFALSLTYVLGMSLMNTLAGIAAAAIGQQIQAIFQQPWIITLFALLFIVLAASMFGLFNLQMPNFLQNKLTDASNRQSAGTFGGVAVMGALSALIVTACVAPPLFAALAVISQTGDILRGGSALFAMSIGMGVPLLIIGTSAGKLIPKVGAWMEIVKKLFGVLMLGVAVWMLTRIVPEIWGQRLWAIPIFSSAWLLWREQKSSYTMVLWIMRLLILLLLAWGVLVLSSGTSLIKSTAPLNRIQFQRIHTLAELDKAVQSATARRQPVMLDFYADWCVSCKEMERDTFTDPKVRAVLSKALLLQADVTLNSLDDQSLLKRFSIFGPPTIAFYDSAGRERSNFRVVGYMKPEQFSSVAQTALHQ